MKLMSISSRFMSGLLMMVSSEYKLFINCYKASMSNSHFCLERQVLQCFAYENLYCKYTIRYEYI